MGTQPTTPIVEEKRRGGFLNWLTAPEPPGLALEFGVRTLRALRVGRFGAEARFGAAGIAELDRGVLRLSMSEPNVLDRKQLVETLQRLLEKVGSADRGRVGIVLPDPVARIAIVSGVELAAAGESGLGELVRFRLKKAVPFDIREARVSFSPMGSLADGVLAVVVLESVIRGYEEACESVGLNPGRVEISSLTLADWVFDRGIANSDVLVLNGDVGWVSLSIFRAGRPLLVRTLDATAVADAQALFREIGSTLIYYRERLEGWGLSAAWVRLIAPQVPLDALAEVLGVAARPLDPWPFGDRNLPTPELAAATALVVSRSASR